MLSDAVKETATKIGQFYLEKNNGDFKATEIEINRTHITQIDVTCDAISIYTERPGVLIGKYGENILALEKFLNIKLCIIEEDDALSDYLIPQDWSDE